MFLEEDKCGEQGSGIRGGCDGAGIESTAATEFNVFQPLLVKK